MNEKRLHFFVAGGELKCRGTFPKTRHGALSASIRKHKTILDVLVSQKIKIDDGGGSTCALCQLYNASREITKACDGCPVKEKTGRRFCEETPYDRYCENVAGQIAMERREIRFLERLQPKSRRK